MQPDVILRVTKTNEKCLEAYDFTSSESMHLFMSVRRYVNSANGPAPKDLYVLHTKVD